MVARSNLYVQIRSLADFCCVLYWLVYLHVLIVDIIFSIMLNAASNIFVVYGVILFMIL